mmetsp:Transcript_19459/g.74631  ORF Transcript_19459/g.74631 Transcript_19459/m.74631 type:complete len:280 (-) Transcript_19459:2-841(-)
MNAHVGRPARRHCTSYTTAGAPCGSASHSIIRCAGPAASGPLAALGWEHSGSREPGNDDDDDDDDVCLAAMAGGAVATHWAGGGSADAGGPEAAGATAEEADETGGPGAGRSSPVAWVVAASAACGGKALGAGTAAAVGAGTLSGEVGTAQGPPSTAWGQELAGCARIPSRGAEPPAGEGGGALAGGLAHAPPAAAAAAAAAPDSSAPGACPLAVGASASTSACEDSSFLAGTFTVGRAGDDGPSTACSIAAAAPCVTRRLMRPAPHADASVPGSASHT